MSPDQNASSLLSTHYQRLFAVGEGALRAETRQFVEWLFDQPLIHPCTVELLRRDRAEADRFLDHQCHLFVQLGGLFGKFLTVYPHQTAGDAFVCESRTCQEHLRAIDQLLRAPRTVDGDWLSEGSLPENTPINLAIRHLWAFEQQHADFMGNSTIDRLKLQLIELWVEHWVAFRHRADRLNGSAARSLRELIRWTDIGELAPRDFPMPAEQLWSHLRRVHLELQAIATATQDLDSVLTAFKQRSEFVDASRLLQVIAVGGVLRGTDEKLTLELSRYLQEHGVRVWSREQAGQRVAVRDGGAWRPVVVDAVAYAKTTPEKVIQSALRRLYAVMQTASANASTSQALLALFRVGGPVCEVPPLIDFNHFAIRLVHVDLVGQRPSRHPDPPPITPLVLDRDELLGEIDPTPVSGSPWPQGRGLTRDMLLLWVEQTMRATHRHPKRQRPRYRVETDRCESRLPRSSQS